MGRSLRFATDAGPIPAVSFLTRPTLGAPRRALFPGRRWRDALFEGPFQSSFQACLYDLPSGWARLLPTARFNELRQTELVRPGASLIDLGDGIEPFAFVRVGRAKEAA